MDDTIKNIKIHSHTKDYQVQVHGDFSFLENLKSIANSFFVIDKKVYDLYSTYFSDVSSDKLFLIDAIEENKNIQTALQICEEMTAIPAKRNSTLVSLGGGIVQDITGFAANILYRGIHWEYVPTTLLASCDSCIGGKTSLNYEHYKNLLGTFYAPDEIHICSKFFQTLSERDFESGLGEVVKFNVMMGMEGIEKIEKDMPAILQREPAAIDAYLFRSLSFKKNFIEVDEFDRGERIKLNFAHTFGHAFEVMSHYDIPHGTAVAMGTIAANRVSVRRNWLGSSTASRIEKLLLKIIHIDLNHLNVDLDILIDAVHKDKKQTGTGFTIVLMREEDNNVNLEVVRDATRDEIADGVSYLFDLLRSNN